MRMRMAAATPMLRMMLAMVSAPMLMMMMMLLVLVFGGVGVVSMLLGGNFLDYNVLADNPVAGQQWGILIIELGVGITVTGVLLAVYLWLGLAVAIATDANLPRFFHPCWPWGSSCH